MKLHEAREIMGLQRSPLDYETADIRRLYAQRVKEAHPDTGSRCGVSIQELQQARDLLLEALESQKCTCKLCQGVGQVRRGMAWRTCSACRGKGETR